MLAVAASSPKNRVWASGVVSGGQAALAPTPFVALPLGSVRARGWALRQLELQRDGLTGKAEAILPAAGPNSAWKGGNGEDWEKGPYYLRGLVTLAYILNDAKLKAKVKAWIEPILASAGADGFFGPRSNLDWWPRMVVTHLLRDYAEATGDKRVVPFLTNYYRYMLATLPKRRLSGWSQARAGDEIDTVLWLHRRTGYAFLLSLADLLAAQAYPWRSILTDNSFLQYGEAAKVNHGVNVAQALKMPVIYSQRSGNSADRAAYRMGLTHLMRDHGTPFGINTGTERLGGNSSVQGVELCSTVETMLSAETALRIIGEARIGDELETIAFNALPAALSSNIDQYVYYTLPNNVNARVGKVGYEQDHGDDRVPGPQSGYDCCCYNLHMGWPKLVQNSWAATSDGGLAVLVYLPSQVSATVVGGQLVNMVCGTNYPFEDTIRLSIGIKQPTQFPLKLRIPGWCKSPQITINGAVQRGIGAGTFATFKRVWQNGDYIELKFPMSVETVPCAGGSISVRRGPLVYALGMSENWQGNADGSSEIISNSPWNFGLVVNERNPASSFQVVSKRMSANPFETGKAPVALRVQGRQLAEWKLRFDGHLPLEPPASPVASNAPLQTLELVPFGSHMLRISTFPVVGTPPAPLTAWSEDFSGDYPRRWQFQGGPFLYAGKLHLTRMAKGIGPAAVFSDFVYEAEVTLNNGGDAGVLFRTSESTIGNNFYRGYYVGINAQTQAVVLGKSDNVLKAIVLKSTPIAAQQPNRIRVEARGAQIRVWVNDMQTPIIESLDETFATGALGVRSNSHNAAFGNLSARALHPLGSRGLA